MEGHGELPSPHTDDRIQPVLHDSGIRRYLSCTAQFDHPDGTAADYGPRSGEGVFFIP